VVSSLFLWAFLDAKLQGQRPRQLRLTWLLFLDLLIAALLSLALAQPQIEMSSTFAQDTHVIVLMDTSTSMLATDVPPSRIELAKEEVYELIDLVGQNGIVTVISVGNSAELIGDSRQVPDSTLKELVGARVAGATGVQFQAGLALAQAMMSEKKEVVVHVITDGAFDSESLDDLPFTVQWHFIGAEADNQAVISPRLVEIADGQFQMLVKLINYGTEDRTNEVRVITDGIESNRAETIVPAESEIPYLVNISGDVDYVRVEINGNDSLGVDDFTGAGRAVESVVRIALVAENPDPLDRAILAAANVELDIISPADYNYASDYDLTIFRNYLPSEWPDGVILVVDIPINSELLPASGVRAIDQPLEIEIDQLTDGLSFSGVRWQDARGIQDLQSGFTALISAGDTPVLLEQEQGRGNLIVFTPFFEVGNLIRHPVFPLLISNVIESAREFRPEQHYQVGESMIVPIDPRGSGASLQDPVLNDVRISSKGMVDLNQFGQYSFYSQQNSSENEAAYFGVNAGDRYESDISPREWAVTLAEEELEVEDDGEFILDLTPWLLCMVAGLLVLEAWRAWR
jgi:hypothetical protein